MTIPPHVHREEFSPGGKTISKRPIGTFFSTANLRGIRFRILGLVLLALLPTLILMLYLAREHRNQITQDVNQNALRLSRFMAASLERDVKAASSFLSALSQDLENDGTDFYKCPDFLASMDITRELYDVIGVADATGRVRCRIPAGAGQGHLDSLGWFQAAIHESRFSVGYDLNRVLIDKVTMDFGFPVADSSGRINAVIFAALDLEWMNRLAERLDLPQGAALTVTDRQGRTLVRYPHPELWVGKNFPDVPLARSISDRNEGVVESQGIDGVVRLYAFSRVDNGDLSVRIGIPRETAYAEADEAMKRALLALGAVGLLAMAAAWVAGYWLVVLQANRLVTATKALATGNLSTRTGMDHESGEFGLLARAFDEMAESLEWREAQLRESESERTQSESRFTEIIERTPDAILGVDGDFLLSFCNQGAEQMFGWEREHLEGMDLSRLEGTDGKSTRSKSLEGALREKGRERVEAFFVRRDGTTFHADVSVSRTERNGKSNYTLIVRESGD